MQSSSSIGIFEAIERFERWKDSVIVHNGVFWCEIVKCVGTSYDDCFYGQN